MQNNLTEAQRPALAKAFKSLKALDEQFDFWDKKLGHPYIIFLFFNSPYHDLAGTPIQDERILQFKEFIINPLPSQYLEYNLKVIEQYQQHYKRMNLKTELLEITTLKNEYYESLETEESSKNKASIIQDYLRVIDDQVTKQERLGRSNSEDARPLHFVSGYRDKLFFEKQPDLSEKIYEFHDMISLLNGNTIATIRIFLNEESKSKSRSTNHKELTLKQRLIALHYIGALDTIMKVGTATAQADFLHLIICKSSDNIRIQFSTIHDLLYPAEETKLAIKNLQAVRRAFENLEYSSVLTRIDADLQKLTENSF